MDETLGTLVICLFLLYWIFVKDPASPPDKKLDSNTKTYMSILATVLGVWSCYKLYLSKGNGGLSYNFGLLKTDQSVASPSLEPNAPNMNQFGKNIDTVPISNNSGAPRVLNNRSFWSSGTTNEIGSPQTEITASA